MNNWRWTNEEWINLDHYYEIRILKFKNMFEVAGYRNEKNERIVIKQFIIDFQEDKKYISDLHNHALRWLNDFIKGKFNPHLEPYKDETIGRLIDLF